MSTTTPGSSPEAGANRIPFAITVVFALEPGSLADFLPLIEENAATSVAREPGCLRFDVLTPLGEGEGEEVVLYEIYADRAAFDAHLAADHYKLFDERSRPLVRTKTARPFRVTENAKPSAAGSPGLAMQNAETQAGDG